MKMIRIIKAYHNPFYTDKNFWINIARELNCELGRFSHNKYHDKFYIDLSNLKIDKYKDVSVDITIDFAYAGTQYKPKFSYFINFTSNEGPESFEVSYRDGFPQNAESLKESILWSIDNFVKENEEFNNIEEIGD